jgi:hypothetical protein
MLNIYAVDLAWETVAVACPHLQILAICANALASTTPTNIST